MAAQTDDYDFDVALSFAGEDRAIVHDVAADLKERGLHPFYDQDFATQLWGEDLYAYLDDVYRKRARFTIMFVSRHYASKRWTNHERQSAQARALESGAVYVLPVRLDDTELPGLRPTVSYLDARAMTATELAAAIAAKCAGAAARIEQCRTPDRVPAGGDRRPRNAVAIRRAPVSERLMMRAARHLTDRDRLLLTLLWEHRVLTTEQIAEVAFDSLTTARHRLTVLHSLRLVDRFQPRRPDTTAGAYHYVLDHLGSYVVVADRDGDADALDWRKERALAITRSQRLAHLVGANGVFTTLTAAARRTSDADLLLWWSRRRFASWLEEETVHWPDVAASDSTSGAVPHAQPSGYGVWREGAATVPFALEYDRGTEVLGRVAGKIPGYVELAWLLGAPPWTLFAFPSARREANARDALAGAAVPVATAYDVTDPSGPVWLPLDGPDGAGRVRLADLGALCPASSNVSRLLADLAEPGSRERRGRTALSEAGGAPPPTPTDPDGRGESEGRYAWL